jgi:hypothetical protein
MECNQCGYFYQDFGEDFASCHYEGPAAWAPCEADAEAKRIEIERLEWEREKQAIIEEYEMED